MTILDKSSNGDQKNNGNNSADKNQSPPFVNRFANHIQQQAQNFDQNDSLTNRNSHNSNPFAEYIKRAGVVEEGKLPLPKSFPPPSTLNSISSSSSKLVHSYSAPALENKASVDPDDNGATTDDSSIPTTPLNSGKLKRKPAVPISTDMKVTVSGKRIKNLPSSTSSSSDAVIEFQSIIKRVMLDGKFRSHCDDCGSTHHHCCVRTILEAITDYDY